MASCPSPSFEESFDALIEHLQHALKAQKIIRIPEEIENPFRAVSHPSNVSLLRKLLKLFDGKQQHHIFQLAPKSFSGIVFIALHFTYSTTQDKLLHTFMNALRVYRDDSATALCLKKCGLHNIKKAQVQADREAISQRLLQTLLRKYIDGGLEKRLRWTIAQFLSTLVHNDDSATKHVAALSESKHLSTLLRDLDDYVGRFLVSDLLRHLVYHGTNPAIFWPRGTPSQVILSFPAAEHSSFEWLANLHQYFADLDTSLASGAGKQCVLPVSEVVCSRGAEDRADSNAIVVVSDDLTVVMASNDDMLRITSFPIFQNSRMIASLDSNEKKVRMTYLKDSGFELCNGSKSAINSTSLRFEATNDARIAQDMILKGQEDAGNVGEQGGVGKTIVPAATPLPKRSIALMNLWSPDGQHVPSEQSIPHVEHDGDSDTRDASPLQHRFQPLSQQHPIGPWGNQRHGGLDPETASETSFLEAAQDRQALRERLQASQSLSFNLPNASDFNARVDDAVARHKSSKLDLKAVGSEILRRKDGSTNDAPHLPRDTAQHLQKTNVSKHDLLLDRNKGRLTSDAQQPTELDSTVAISPVSTIARPTASLKHQKGSMAKLASAPPLAKSTSKKSTRTPGGAAARLAGSEPQSQQRTSKSTTSVSDTIKRTPLSSKKDRPPKITDWEQDLRDDSHFDIPDDPTDEERPKKRARKGGKSAAHKTTAKSKKVPKPKKTQGSKDSKRPVGGPKRTKIEQRTETLKPTVASTRKRRPQKSTTYVEASGSEVDEEERTRQDAGSASEETSFPIEATAPRSMMAPTEPEKTGIQRRLYTQTPNNPKANDGKKEQKNAPSSAKPVTNTQRDAHHKPSAPQVCPNDTIWESPIETSSPIPDNAASIQKAVIVARPSSVFESQEHEDDLVEEEAPDSYPRDLAGSEVAVAAARDSFGTHLQTLLGDEEVTNDVNERDKEDAPPAAQTPFGNQKNFIANVNAARSTSAKKAPISQISKFLASHTPHSIRRSATKATETAAIRSLPEHLIPVTVAKPGKDRIHNKISTKIAEETEEIVHAEPAHDDLIVTGDGEVHENRTSLPEQLASKEGNVHVAGATATSHKTRVLGAMLPEVSYEAGNSMVIQSRNIDQLGLAGSTRIANIPQQPETSGPGTPADDSFQHLPNKRTTSVEIVNSKGPAAERASDVGADLEAMTDASTPGKSPLMARMVTPKDHISAIAVVHKTVIATGAKQAIRASTTHLPGDAETPRQEVHESIAMLISEKTTKKPSVVQFGAQGPLNQGVWTGAKRVSEAYLPPPETEKQCKAKQHEIRTQSADTPSHQPGPLMNRSDRKSEVSEKNEGGEEGSLLDVDVELGPENSTADFDHASEPEEEYREPRGPGLVRQLHVDDHSESVDASPGPEIANDTSPDVCSHHVSVQDASSLDSEDDETSEYEEELDSVDTPGETEEHHDGKPGDHQVDPHAPLVHVDSEVRETSIGKIVKEFGTAPRESIGLNQLLRKSYPEARHKISTSEFRASHEEVIGTNAINVSTFAEHKAQKSITDALLHGSPSDAALIPPPKSKPRQSAGNGPGHDAVRIIPARQGSSDTNAIAGCTANPLAQLSSASAPPPAESRLKNREGDETGRRLATAPIRVKRPSKSKPSLEPAAPVGTPVRFHAKLTEASTRVSEASDQRKLGSYMSEGTADATLVDGNPLSMVYRPPSLDEPQFERGTTETTDESPPASSTAGDHMVCTEKMVWQNPIHPPYRSLFEDMMQIANGVLFRLGQEEDAIRAKVTQFSRGGSIVLEELDKSWNRRVLHEHNKILQSLSAGRKALAVKLDNVGKDVRGGTQQWKRIQRLSNMVKMADTREQHVIGRLEKLTSFGA